MAGRGWPLPYCAIVEKNSLLFFVRLRRSSRNFLADLPTVEAMEFLLERIKRTKNNKEFFATMAQ